jgi:hypothetical protein
MHPAQLPLEKLLADCRVERTRRSGPGGQHRNKVETAVVVTHLPTGIRGEASERRSQEANRQKACWRLRMGLAIGIRVPYEGELSACWRGRIGQGRLQVSATHDDFPALMAEALDVVASREWDVAAAAEELKITTSQLVKFLRQDHRALAQLNQERNQLGLSGLR